MSLLTLQSGRPSHTKNHEMHTPDERHWNEEIHKDILINLEKKMSVLPGMFHLHSLDYVLNTLLRLLSFSLLRIRKLSVHCNMYMSQPIDTVYRCRMKDPMTLPNYQDQLDVFLLLNGKFNFIN